MNYDGPKAHIIRDKVSSHSQLFMQLRQEPPGSRGQYSRTSYDIS